LVASIPHAGIVEVTEARGDRFWLIRSQSLERENVIAATNVEIDPRRASSAMPPATDL
jgi:hypothetical protein